MTAAQWVLIGLVIAMIIVYPILTISKNKKVQQQYVEQANSLKRGDKILTTSGIYGTVLEVREENGVKKVVMETGNAQYKSYMTIDAYSIYAVLNQEKVEEPKVEEKPTEEKVEPKKEAKSTTKAKKSTKKEG